MKINGNMPGFNISAVGLSVQRKKMNLIAENIANMDTTRTQDGQPYQRKYVSVKQGAGYQATGLDMDKPTLQMTTTDSMHIASPEIKPVRISEANTGLKADIEKDQKQGEVVYNPEHPDADKDGYVHMANVNIVTEMTDMISATRSFEANITALNSSKQMAKDSLEI
jgi:flagellar basal-body rod protein FlgC